MRPARPPHSSFLVPGNGGAGALFLDEQQRLIAVWSLEITGGQITGIRSIVNPDKLRHMGPVGDFGALVKAAR
jgi:RNA polymerase sigma-70 factor (ECF subfamily)